MQTLATPIYYSLELTSLCNSRCPVCGNVFMRRRQALSATEWRQILEHLAPHAESFKLTGGEATLHPEFPTILEAVAGTGVPFALFTNGRWRDPAATIKMLARAANLSGILISLHGANAGSHEAFTQTPGSFEETCANLQQAAAAGVRIHSSTVITRQNYHQVDEIAALSRSLGARRAVFNRYLGAAAPALEPDAAQLRHAVQGIEQLIQRHAGYGRDEFDVRYGNCIPQCFTPSSSSGCWAGIAYCTIDPWGNLRPCNHSPTIVGNLFESSITELWHSETMTRWRGLTPAGCADCTAFDLCRGGCRALVELRQQDPLIGEPLSEHEAPRIIQLPQHRRPLLACTVRPESFGYSLVRGHALVQATHAAESLLDRLDGTMSLQEVSDEYGEDGLEFVGVLYLNGMLSLAN